VQFGEKLVKNNSYLKYLDVVLDRTLTFKNHLAKLAVKIKTRHSIIAKLSGTSWEADASTISINTLALVYSATEYCAPVWINSHFCFIYFMLFHVVYLSVNIYMSKFVALLCHTKYIYIFN